MATVSACTLFPPQTVPCGEYGVCIEGPNITQPFCACIPGYTAFGDFSVLATNPCDININAIRGLWAATAASVLFAYGVSLWGFLSRRQSGPQQWKAWRFWILPYFVFIQASAVLAMSIGKFLNPDQWIVGSSYPMTILHGCSALLAVTVLVIGLVGVARAAYADPLRSKTSGDRLETKIKLRKLESAIFVFWIFAGFSSFVPIAILMNTDNLRWAAGVHGCGLAFDMIVVGVCIAPTQFSLVLEKVTESLNANAKNQTSPNTKMKTVSFKLRLAKNLARIGFTMSALWIILIALWPFMIVKTAYFLPVFYFFVEIVAGLFIWITTTTSSLSLKRPSLFSKRLSNGMSPNLMSRRSTSTSRNSPGVIAGGRKTLDAALLPLTLPPAPATPDF